VTLRTVAGICQCFGDPNASVFRMEECAMQSREENMIELVGQLDKVNRFEFSQKRCFADSLSVCLSLSLSLVQQLRFVP